MEPTPRQIRFQTDRQQTAPPAGTVDVFWSKERNSLRATRADGADVPAVDEFLELPASHGAPYDIIYVEGTFTTDGSTPAYFLPMKYEGEDGGKPAFRDVEGSGSHCWWDTDRWFLTHNDETNVWESSEDVDSPEKVTSWTGQADETAQDVEIIRSYPFPPDSAGQWLRVGNTTPFDWYQAETETLWVPRVLGGALVYYNPTIGKYQILAVTGAEGSESIAFQTINIDTL